MKLPQQMGEHSCCTASILLELSPKLKKERMLSKWNVLMSLPCKVPSSHRSTDDELFTSDDKLTSPNEPD